MTNNNYQRELEQCIRKILNSAAQNKLIVAGPGTGKSTFFERIITHTGGSKSDFVVLTFINNLEEELRKDVGDISQVYTFHGYCHYLLRKNSNLRIGLSNSFNYYPPLIKLIKSDWKIIKNKEDDPEFTNLMRRITESDELDFYIQRGNYYDSVSFEDSVYRVFKNFVTISNQPKLFIVDEYQDFNLLETLVLDKLISDTNSLVVGDDDQALYCNLRDSDPEYIRTLYFGKKFENFELPFCLRCPQAIISVFTNIVDRAIREGLLVKRIKKKFSFFPPAKQKDSEQYKKVRFVRTSIQKKTPLLSNYMGRYIVQEIKKIPANEIKESVDKKFPTVLIIGPGFYLDSIVPILEESGLKYKYKEESNEMEVKYEDGLNYIRKDPKSNIGWRIILETEKPSFFTKTIQLVAERSKPLVDFFPKEFVDQHKKRSEIEVEKMVVNDIKKDESNGGMTIRLTTSEGAKGLSAQHVFIIGLQNNLLPRNKRRVLDIEVCRLLVALTRTRKQCHLMSTKYFGGEFQELSEFVNWIDSSNLEHIEINKLYWDGV